MHALEPKAAAVALCQQPPEEQHDFCTGNPGTRRTSIIAEPEHGVWNSYSIDDAIFPHTSEFGLIRKRACAKHARMDVHVDVHVAILG
jgi:hypothetical protein